MKNKIVIYIVLLILFIGAIYFSLYFGSVSFSQERIALWQNIVWGIRFPRMLLAILTGATLALGGVVYQALLKNSLAEPYLLGVSSGAAFGAVAMAAVGINFIPGGAFLGAIFSFFLIISLAKLSGKVSTFSLILSGVVMNAFFGALISLLISFFSRKTFGIIFWLMGNLEVYDLKLLSLFIILFIIVTSIIYLFSSKLDLMALGEEDAYHLGINTGQTRIVLFLLSTMLVAMAVALTGIIGFVGLVVPHFARILVGAKHIRLIPMALLLGAIFVLIGNALIYGILKNPDLPIGVFTALLGIPFLFYLFLSNKSANS